MYTEENQTIKKLVSVPVGEAVMAAVDEVLRQEQLWNRFAEEWDQPDTVKLAILAEEFGEIAMALNDKDHDNLPVELVQTAAVCLSWIASIYHKSSSSSQAQS